jgi:5'-deoxynucleotidase YfbR-like HD superfamily hydrolase
MQSFTIKRYEEGYAEGIFYDSVGSHIFRCADEVEKRPKGDYSKEKVRLYLLIHDLHEIVTSDFTAIQKEDSALSQKLEALEKEAIQTILPESYWSILDEFDNAGKLLKGEDLEVTPPPEAIIAKVIDTFDGDVFFHKALSKWVSSEQYDSDKIPSEQALSYIFLHTPKQIESIQNSNYDDGVKKLCLSILRDKLLSVRNSWEKVPEILIPETISGYISFVDNFMKK